MINMLKNLHKEEAGQDLIEYALIALLLAVGSVAVLGNVSAAVNGVFGKVNAALGQ
jgi:Flp pilus assembly pilin Flp